MKKYQRALSIAGFDGSGGAGMQADLKTFSALGCYGMSVLTSLPIQNTLGVKGIHDLPVSCITEQLKAILEDIGTDVVKIGMLHREEIIFSVAKILHDFKLSPIVLDPVMVAKSGDFLLLPNAITAMKKYLFPLATVITPNLPEASQLLEREITTKEQMEQAAKDLAKLGPQAVVVKGGHLTGYCEDCLCIKNEIHWFSHPRIQTKNTHGTGCTFSAAIAAFLCRGLTIYQSIKNAKDYLTNSMEAGAQFTIGHGHGPVHHFHKLWSHFC